MAQGRLGELKFCQMPELGQHAQRSTEECSSSSDDSPQCMRPSDSTMVQRYVCIRTWQSIRVSRSTVGMLMIAMVARAPS
eukprot:4718109-Prymnesium_polylepis.1